MTYFWKSPVGTFWIRPGNVRGTRGARWDLGIDGETLGNFEHPEQAADDVYMHVTGYFAWDNLDPRPANAPSDLSEWEHRP